MRNPAATTYGLAATLLTLYEGSKGQVSMDAAVIVCILFALTLKD